MNSCIHQPVGLFVFKILFLILSYFKNSRIIMVSRYENVIVLNIVEMPQTVEKWYSGCY